MEKIKVVASKGFGGAPVMVSVTAEGISMAVNLDDFLMAVATGATKRLAEDAVRNAGNPALVMTNAQLLARISETIKPEEVYDSLHAAAQSAVGSLKQASVVAE